MHRYAYDNSLVRIYVKREWYARRVQAITQRCGMIFGCRLIGKKWEGTSVAKCRFVSKARTKKVLGRYIYQDLTTGQRSLPKQPRRVIDKDNQERRNERG